MRHSKKGIALGAALCVLALGFRKQLHLQRLFVFYRKYREWGREGEKHEIPDETCPDGVEQL